MSNFDCFCQGPKVRAVLACLCAILLSAMASIATAGRGDFRNDPHGTGGNNPVGAFIGSGGMNFNQGGLRGAVTPSFGQGGGSGSSGLGISGASGKGGFTGSGGPQSISGPGAASCGGFDKGHGDKDGKGQSTFNNIFCGKDRGGGYQSNGLIMTRCGSDVVVRLPFDGGGKKDGSAFGCGDAFSEVLSGTDCARGSFDVPKPIGARGPNPHHGGWHPKKGDGNPGGGNCNGHWGEGNKGKGKGNRWTGNCGHGVGEGMCGKCCHHDTDDDSDIDTDIDTDIDLDNDTDIDLDNDTDIDLDNDIDTDNDVVGVPAAPLWDRPQMEFSGCPALTQWLAGELGLPKEQLGVHIANTLATFRDINPCDLCARLQSAALILRDEEGTRISALTTVLEEVAAPGAPISPEQMMQIAQQLAEPEPGSVYEQAAQYLSAAQTYVTILRDELGYSTDGSFSLAAKYIEAIENTEAADYVTARLINLGQ